MVDRFKISLRVFLHDCAGSNAIEYAFVASAVGLALIPILPAIAAILESTFTALSAGFN